MIPVASIKKNLDKILKDLRNSQYATPAQRAGLEFTILQAETLEKALCKLQDLGISREYIETDKTPEDLGRIFDKLAAGGYLFNKASGCRERFIEIFNPSLEAPQGLAIWEKKYRNKKNLASLADFLFIAGVERQSIKVIAKDLFQSDLSDSTISEVCGRGGTGSAFHEDLIKIWRGE